MATFIKIGESAHDLERQALRFLVDGLPPTYTVYGNAWLVERSGVIHELDAVVVAPHAIFVVEIKGFRGRIDGTDHDWYTPDPQPSPLKRNRLTAQTLRSLLKRQSFQAGQVWVEGLVFLSATTDVQVKGTASRDRLHTRKTILSALQDPALIQRLSSRPNLAPTSGAESDLLRLLTGFREGPKPVRLLREYEVQQTLDHQETFTELLARNRLTEVTRVLRIYSVPPLATDEQRARVIARARWEAQVLARLGRIEGVLAADSPFEDEAGIVLPLEWFKGITLTSWVERYAPGPKATKPASLIERTDLWLRLAQTLDEAHQQGVVHRLLRPEVVLVEDAPCPRQLRVTGFDLAKQLSSDQTVIFSTLQDDRLVYAAPEVVHAFSSAEPASDQFSLGALLALILTGRPLFESTRQMMAARRLLRRVRDLDGRVPLRLDEAVARMVQLRPLERYPRLADALAEVRAGREPESAARRVEARAPLDADNLPDNVRIGTDYEIVGRLGQGGLAVVYAARHLISGRTRALKIARANDGAEEALRGEYQVLHSLDHPNIVRVLDLSNMIEGRLTLVMERVSGETLRAWLRRHPRPEPNTLRRLAEDLLSGLEYLEQRGITHKDLKPDNLLVSDERLVLIDFSLAAVPANAPYVGTALYRDPHSVEWTHGADRYAAALCLFELYAGRHPFDGDLPAPDLSPDFREEDIDPPGLAALFTKALHPVPALRFPSARALREALLAALGDPPRAVSATAAAGLDATTPLSQTGLSRRAVQALTRGQIRRVGDLLAISPAEIRALHMIGTKAAAEVEAFRERLLAQDLQALPSELRLDPPLVPALVDSPEPVQKLALPAALRAALEAASLPTVGAVASLTQAGLLAVPGIGRQRLVQVVDALHAFRDATPSEAGTAHTLDGIWDLAARPLNEAQRQALERAFGVVIEADRQGEGSAEGGRASSPGPAEVQAALDRLDQDALAELTAGFDQVLDGLGGLARLDDIALRLQGHWPAGQVAAAGLVRLLVRLSAGRAQVLELDGADGPLVAAARFDLVSLQGFLAELERLAQQWPPVEPESARRALAALLPYAEGDPLALGVRLASDVYVASTGHLFSQPLAPERSLKWVLDASRGPVPLSALRARVHQVFGPATPFPEPDHLLALLGELDCQVVGDQVAPGRSRSVLALAPTPPDALPTTLGADRSPEAQVADLLRQAARSRGFRLLITPPERHAEIGRSVASALGGRWISFEDHFFGEHGADLDRLERAERFVSQREALTEAAEATLFGLLETHGAPGQVVVVGDTALLGLCEALDLPRRLYDETLSGSRGFWVLVVPGVIHNRQPRFNEGPPLWHLEGATLPLLKPLPGAR